MRRKKQLKSMSKVLNRCRKTKAYTVPVGGFFIYEENTYLMLEAWKICKEKDKLIDTNKIVYTQPFNIALLHKVADIKTGTLSYITNMTEVTSIYIAKERACELQVPFLSYFIN